MKYYLNSIVIIEGIDLKKTRVVYVSLCLSVIITISLFYLYMNIPPCELMVTGRSMIPTIYPNDVVYGYALQSFNDTAVGDIVVFWYPRARSMSFCHRIIEIRSDMIIICHGDNNPQDAVEVISFDQIRFKVVWIIHHGSFEYYFLKALNHILYLSITMDAVFLALAILSKLKKYD